MPNIQYLYSRPRTDVTTPDDVTSLSSSLSIDPGKPSYDPKLSNLDKTTALHKGKQTCSQHPISVSLSYFGISSIHSNCLSTIFAYPIPKTVKEALSQFGWRTTMDEEMITLEENGTWELVMPPPNTSIVSCESV